MITVTLKLSEKQLLAYLRGADISLKQAMLVRKDKRFKKLLVEDMQQAVNWYLANESGDAAEEAFEPIFDDHNYSQEN